MSTNQFERRDFLARFLAGVFYSLSVNFFENEFITSITDIEEF